MRFRDLLRPRRRTPVDAYLGLGSNVGARLDTIEAAVRDLHDAEGIDVTALSGVYDTEPVGGIEQDPYLNAVVAVRTTLAPQRLLTTVQAIEERHGRDRSREQRWGPRTLDIDILLYGDRTIDDEDLVVPHPRLRERAFVLVPLMEVMPAGELPDGTRLSSIVAEMAPIEGVELHVRLAGLPGSGPERPAGPPGPGAFLADEWERPVGPPPGVER
ncbi:MAG: 2-amino-4-hydroxy-6-hydroxymethyldihydropteridine diphosphokinase [Actinobacteria bacterium]|nr:2-amino-4-hydroxy-6-hydroxymethyldihydropteridine diphosphokinase [Actinomycetota bacterium]